MALIKYRLGDLLQLLEEKNDKLQYGIDSVRGVNNLKKMMPTKADLNGRDLSKFQIVQPGEFFFNHRTSRNGSKFSITYNDEESAIICTEDYVVFRIRPECENIILINWLYMYFNRSEFDRYVITNSWGSSTEFYNWEDICSIEINLPSLAVQRKYVDIYEAMITNQKSYDKGLDDLKVAIDALIDKYKHSSERKSVGSILEEIDNRNDDGITEVQGINITKQFMPSVADTLGINLKKYKLVKHGQFAYSGMQTGRDECIRIALYRGDESIIISPAYTVLQTRDESVIPEYIMMWFSRKESDRLGWFMSDGSIRSNLDLDRFYETEIPVPEKKIQEAMVELYDVFTTRRIIGEQLKNQIKDICPILIKGSIEEARKEA